MKKSTKILSLSLGLLLISTFVFADLQIKTNIQNAIQTIKRINITSDGTASGTIYSQINSDGNGMNIFGYSGNGGIGINTKQLSGMKLRVNGKVGAIEYCNYSGADCVDIGTFANIEDIINQNNHWIKTGNNIFYNSGNVGIQTNSPNFELEVNGDIGADAFLYRSDKKLKTNIKKIENTLSKIKKINGYSFEWKKNGKKDIGLIAQEIEKIYPDLVNTDKNGLKSVKYGNINAILIESIKELDNMIKKQENEIKLLQEQIKLLK